MNKTIKTGLALSLVLSASGCSWLFGDDGVFRDSSDDYRKARIEKPLELPEGIEAGIYNDSYAIPEISDRSALSGGFVVPSPEPMSDDIDRDAVRINTLGNDQWILANGSPGQIWPRLRSFFNINKLSLQRADAVTGVLETVWLQPSAENALKERYRLRIDQGVQRGTSEIYILHADSSAGNERWPESSSNPQREQLMMQEMAQFLANNTTGGSVSMLAQQAIDSSGRVTLEQDGDAEPYVRLQLPFSRAWASLGRAIRKAGITIDDLDREQRIYYVRYDQEQQDDEEPGWFSSWFGDDDESENITGQAYYIRMTDESSQTVEITVERQSGEPMDDGEADLILKLIKRHLS